MHVALSQIRAVDQRWDLTLSALEMEPRPWLTLARPSLTELHSQPPTNLEQRKKESHVQWGGICLCRSLGRSQAPRTTEVSPNIRTQLRSHTAWARG